jgi:hypothetical protein
VPATFPSHAAAVLPLKLWRPRWFDGVALVVGSTAPDLAYPLVGLVSLPETHTLAGLFWFCLPVGLVATWLIRRSAPIVAAHLPGLGDYGVLGVVRHRWWVTVSSLLLGALTHLFWDGFTHDPAGHGWAVGLIGYSWWHLAQGISSVVGGFVAIWCFWRIGRTRALRRWHGPPPVVPVRPRVFVSAAAVVLVGCLAWMPILPYRLSAHVSGVRLIWAVAAALLAGALAVRLHAHRTSASPPRDERPVSTVDG